MYLNRLLTIFAATVISMTALTSCVVLNEDQPEVKRMLTVNESVNEQGYIVEKGYTMTDSEIFVCFYSRARILISEEKYNYSVEVPNGAYTLVVRIDVYGRPRGTYGEKLLVARLTTDMKLLPDASHGDSVAIAGDDITSVEYMVADNFELNPEFMTGTLFSKLMTDYGYRYGSSQCTWIFFDVDGNEIESTPKATTAAKAQPVFNVYGTPVNGSFVQQHVLTVTFDRRATADYAAQDAVVDADTPHDVEYVVLRNYVLNATANLGSYIQELLKDYGYIIAEAAYFTRACDDDGSVRNESKSISSLCTTEPFVEYYVDVAGYPRNGNYVREQVLTLTFKRIKSEKISEDDNFVLTADMPHRVKYKAMRNYVLNTQLSLSSYISGLMADYGYNTASTDCRLRFFDNSGNIKGESAKLSGTCTKEPYVQLFIEVNGYAKGGSYVSEPVLTLTFDRIESAEISLTDNFTFTSEMPHTVEYLVEKPTN